MKIQSIIYIQTGLGMGFSVILLVFYSCLRCIVTCKLYSASSVLVYTWMVSYNVMVMIYERVCTICKRVLFLCMWLSSDQMVLTMLTFFYQIDLGAGRKFLLLAPQTDMVSSRKCKVFLPLSLTPHTPHTPTHPFFFPLYASSNAYCKSNAYYKNSIKQLCPMIHDTSISL